jgi:hypothetical protein
MVAAVVVSDGAELATRNIGDFRGLKPVLAVTEL